MTQQVEFEGSNVEKAALAASKKLKIPTEELKYQVISYGSTGIFGLVGTKKAKIRVFLPKEKKAAERESPPVKEKDTLTQTAAPKEEGVSEPELPENREAAKKLGLEALERITHLISDDVRISTEEIQEELLYKIKSSDAAVMIGKRGQTLEAIQYLVEKIINKQNSERIHVQVDVEGYLKKRRVSLQGLASRMAEKALKTGRPVTIGQMSAYERKIVHIFLKENKRVRTQSKGDGFLRKLVIFPVRNSKKRKAKAKV